MTALLFIPSTAGAACGRRVDLANLASRFAVVDEPAPRRARGRAGRIALLILILVGAIGDLMLVSQHEALASSLAASQPARASEPAAS